MSPEPMSASNAIEKARRLGRSSGPVDRLKVEALLSEAEESPEHYEEARLARGNFYLTLGEYDDAAAIGIELSKSTDDGWAGLGFNLQGVVALERGDYASAMDAFDRSLQRIPESDERARGNVENNLGLVCWRLGQLEPASGHFMRAARAFGADEEAAVAVGNIKNNLGMVLLEAGERDRAKETLEEALDLLRGDPGYQANVLSSLATIEEEKGRPEVAEEKLRKVLQTRRSLGYKRGIAGTCIALARLAIAREDSGEAERLLEEARGIATTLGLRKQLADVQELQSMWIASQGRWKEAFDARVKWEQLREELVAAELQERVEQAHNRAVLQEARRVAESRRIEAEELRIARDQATEALSARTSFLATMSHEIRTPLNGILGMTTILLRRESTEEGTSYLQIIDSSARGLLSIINDILDYSKIEAGGLHVENAPFHLPQVVDEVMRLFRATAQKKVPIHLQLDLGLRKWFLGDALRTRQVLVNLIGNALKFTEEGEVQVVIRQASDDRVRFSVEDTGPGISAEHCGRLFEPFRQADSSTSRKFGGTGLGLAISRSLVEMMEGEIGVESRLGQGSTFWFELPLPEGDPQEVQGPPPDGTAGKSLKDCRILLAEDNRVNQIVIQALLEHLGCELEIVENGFQAVSAFFSRNHDLILMDCQMPIMDGYRSAREIRRQEKGGDRVPIIAITAAAMPEEREKCLASGMDDYIPKPIDESLLLRCLARWFKAPRGAASPPGPVGQELDESRLQRLVEVGRAAGRDLVSEILKDFGRRSLELVQELRGALTRGDRQSMEGAAHSLRGSAGVVGAVSLADACKNLEEAAAREDAPCAPLIQVVEDEQERALKLLETWQLRRGNAVVENSQENPSRSH